MMNNSIGINFEDMRHPDLSSHIENHLFGDGTSTLRPIAQTPPQQPDPRVDATHVASPVEREQARRGHLHQSDAVGAGLASVANGMAMGLPSLAAPETYANLSDANTGSPVVDGLIEGIGNGVGATLSGIGLAKMVPSSVDYAGRIVEPKTDLLRNVVGSSGVVGPIQTLKRNSK